MLKYSLFILHSIVEVGGVYDEAQHEGGGGGGRKEMSLDAFWTQLHTRMKDETRRLAEKNKISRTISRSCK